MIKKAFGGILLVDEAYYLYNAANDKDYGSESIEILLNVMEEQKDDLIVTLAGFVLSYILTLCTREYPCLYCVQLTSTCWAPALNRSGQLCVLLLLSVAFVGHLH